MSWIAVASVGRHRFPNLRCADYLENLIFLRKRRPRCALPAQSKFATGLRKPVTHIRGIATAFAVVMLSSGFTYGQCF
jgi:hypothetical protein